MSFYLGVWNSPTAISNDEAASRYSVLRDQESAQPRFDEQVYGFYCRLTNLYPEVEMVPEDELDACPWACSIDTPGSHVIMAIQPDKFEEVLPKVVAIAERHQLICFDPQAGKVYLPSQLKAKQAPWPGSAHATASLRGSPQAPTTAVDAYANVSS